MKSEFTKHSLIIKKKKKKKKKKTCVSQNEPRPILTCEPLSLLGLPISNPIMILPPGTNKLA